MPLQHRNMTTPRRPNPRVRGAENGYCRTSYGCGEMRNAAVVADEAFRSSQSPAKIDQRFEAEHFLTCLK